MTAIKTSEFEGSLQKLESLIERMENDNLNLEQALQCFEEGVKLTKSCQKALSEAEQKVKIMTQSLAEQTE